MMFSNEQNLFWFVVFMSFFTLTSQNEVANNKTCFAPVVCLVSGIIKPDWQQVFPPIGCETRKMKCQKGHEQSSDSCSGGPQGAKGEEGESSQNITKIIKQFEKTLSDQRKTLQSLQANLSRSEDEITKVKGEVIELRSELNNTRGQITNLDKELNLTREKLSETKNTQNCTGSSAMLEYDNKCFLGIIHGPSTINYATAERLCIENGSHPANIYSRNHSIAVHRYIRKLMSGKWTDGWLIMGAWLGMTYNPSTNETRNYDGSLSTVDFQWYQGFPKSFPASTQLSMTVIKRAGGVTNRNPSNRRAAVLCEIN